MQAKQIVDALQNHKGQHLKVIWERQCKAKGATVEKRVTAYVRSGIDYANLKTVREAIEARERGEVQPIWNGFGEWAQFPFVIRHVTKGTEYLRLYPSSFKNLRPSTEWKMNGKKTTYKKVERFLKSSELKKDEIPSCFTVKAEDVQEII